jgi:hypothetical protein
MTKLVSNYHAIGDGLRLYGGSNKSSNPIPGTPVHTAKPEKKDRPARGVSRNIWLELNYTVLKRRITKSNDLIWICDGPQGRVKLFNPRVIRVHQGKEGSYTLGCPHSHITYL